MKLIIDIDKEDYERLHWTTIGKTAVDHSEKLRKYILNGTPVSTDGDTISRSALKKAITDRLVSVTHSSDYADGLQDGYLNTINEIDNAPAVEPYISPEVLNQFAKYVAEHERPKGKWHHSGECSVCHKRSLRTTPLGDIIGIDLTDFCKNCGAKMDMRGENDGFNG